MNRLPRRLLIVFIVSWIFFLPVAGTAAPVGNVGDPMLWSPGPFRQEGGLALVVSATIEKQANRLPSQMTRFAWSNPDILPPEERHYQQSRSSKNTLTTMGAKIGVPYRDSALFYAVVGTSDATIDFHYEDWTISRVFFQDHSFESGPNAYFGLGTSFIMHQAEYRKTPVTLGMDISYRHYTIEENRLSSDGLYYASDLDEIQIALCLSAKLKRFQPYAGVKVASVTGTEDYVNKNYATSYFKEGYIHYTEDITWSKNLGYFIGVSSSIKGLLSLGLEVRGGDESAVGVSATTRF